LATFGAGTFARPAVRSVIVADVPIVVVLGVGFIAFSFPDRAIFA
jgi:hypothetical protein